MTRGDEAETWPNFGRSSRRGVTCAVLGLAAFWLLTLPAMVPASALPPYTPNVDNGKTMFNIGGCASCHAVPNDDPDKVDRTRLGGGLALKSPFGTFYVPNISPDPKDGIGVLERGEFRHRVVEGNVGARQKSLPGVSLHLLSAHAAQRRARSLRLSEDAAAGAGQVAPARSVVSVQRARAARRLETAVLPRRPVTCPIRRNRRNGIAAPIW